MNPKTKPMSQTPQPEESPDEILARRIEKLKIRIALLTVESDKYVGGTESFFQLIDEISKAQKDLAMLEAMRALRKLAQRQLAVVDPNVPFSEFALIQDTLRQSDNAIRGMRG